MPVCTTDKSYEGEGVNYLTIKFFHRFHSENVPQVPNVINLIHALLAGKTLTLYKNQVHGTGVMQ